MQEIQEKIEMSESDKLNQNDLNKNSKKEREEEEEELGRGGDRIDLGSVDVVSRSSQSPQKQQKPILS